MSEKISIAPMMNVTDRHFRMFLRLLSARIKLYTEMKVSGAIIHGDRARLLDFGTREHPLAIQLAGADAVQLAACARLAEDAGYDEVNLNIGCPSSRVQGGGFGACLLAEPALVARCVGAMCAATSLPVTVKTRTGVDHRDTYEHLADFVTRVSAAGCRHFIIHARKAWLQGLSPRENRTVPALQYERVYRLKQNFPDIRFTVNGGVNTLQDARRHLSYVDGVMIGREARRDPWMLNAVDEIIFDDTATHATHATRADAVNAYLPYVEQQLTRGVHLRQMIRPLFGLFHGQPHARSWRRHLCTHDAGKNVGTEVIRRALEMVNAT